MDRLVRLVNGGRVVRTKDDSVQLIGMMEEMLVFLESPHLTEVVERAKEMLASILGDVPFRLQGVVDVGSSHGLRIKRLLKITRESEWFAYKAVVLSS
jgi:hypothetical protein